MKWGAIISLKEDIPMCPMASAVSVAIPIFNLFWNKNFYSEKFTVKWIYITQNG